MSNKKWGTDDRIVYMLARKPGGIDGKDLYDKGEILAASFNKVEIERSYDEHRDPWLEIRKEVIVPADIAKGAIEKLSALEKMVLGLNDGEG